tara:strand:+ start:135 stop:308 length:174 start_codon:yes stop_codon:yes gene_type:complete
MEFFGINLFMWGELASVLLGLMTALVLTNWDLIEALIDGHGNDKGTKDQRPCQKPCL